MSRGTGEIDGIVDVSNSGKIIKIIRATTRFTIDLRERRDMSDVEKETTRKRRKALDDLLRMATLAKNIAMRQNWRADSGWLDDILAQDDGVMPRKPVWSGKLYSYPLIRRTVPDLSSQVAATIQRAVDMKWLQVRYDVLIRQSESCPHFRVGQPAPLPLQAVRLTKEGDAFVVVFSPYSSTAKNAQRIMLCLEPRDALQKTQLESLVRSKDDKGKIVPALWRMGQITIERDRTRLSRFYLRISYTRLVEQRTAGRSAAINRGLRSFVAAVIDSGESWVYDGEDIEAYLKQVQRRRREYQYASKASERWGRGRARTIRPIEALTGKAERWRETRNQVLARRLARWLAERDVSIVYIEDFGGIRSGEPEKLEGGKFVWDRIQEWPYYQLGMRLASCLEEDGIQTLVVPAQYISQKCPRCGEVREEHADRRFWQLRCTTPKCGFKRHLDVGAALNVLARGEALRAGGTKDFELLRSARESKKATARKAARNRMKGQETNGTGEKT